MAKRGGTLTQVVGRRRRHARLSRRPERGHAARLALARRRAARARPADPRLRPLPRRRLRRRPRRRPRRRASACATPGSSRSRWSPARAASTSSARCAAATTSATVHSYARALAERMVADDPRRLTLEWQQGRPRQADLRRRQPDQLRPARRRRPTASAPARRRRSRCRSTGRSCPSATLQPDRWTIATCSERIADIGNPWEGFGRRARALPV